MKLLLKLFLSVVLLLFVLLCLGYALLRSQWGIAAACRWISNTTDYHLSIKRFTHHWSAPLTVDIDNVTFGEDGKPALLIADNISLSFSLHQLLTPSHFSQIILRQGSLVLSNLSPEATLPFSADRLQFQAIKLLNPYSANAFSANKIDGVLIPWQPSQQAVLGNKFTFHFSADGGYVGHQYFTKLAAQGEKDHQQLYIERFSGAVERGTFEGQLTRSAEGVWQIPHLQLDNIRFQTEKNISDLFAMHAFPKAQIGQLTVNHLSIVGPNWVINDLSAQGRDLTHREQLAGQLSLNAESVILDTEQFSHPYLNLRMKEGQVSIEQFNTGWAKGTVSAQGEWREKTGELAVNTLDINDIRYTLPTTWRQSLQAPLPALIRTVTLKTLRLDNALLIDINPDFPFQMTGVHLQADQLQIAQDRQWGIWGGNAEYYAAATTFNRQDIRALWFKLTATQESIAVQDIKALISEGPVIGDLQLSQSKLRPFSLSLRGEKVPYTAFTHWFWPHSLSGQGSFTLTLEGELPSVTDAPSQLKGEFTTPTFRQPFMP